jgi:hypothetical protein
VTETDVEVFRRTYETNVFGVAAVTNAFLPIGASAHRQPLQRTGSLTWSTGPNPQFDYQAAGTGSGAAYRSSKTALNALTVFYAQALAGDGIKVNAVAPGLRATNLSQQAAAAGGDPADAAAGAIRLALLSDDGPTGQLFARDGTAAPCKRRRTGASPHRKETTICGRRPTVEFTNIRQPRPLRAALARVLGLTGSSSAPTCFRSSTSISMSRSMPLLSADCGEAAVFRSGRSRARWDTLCSWRGAGLAEQPA